MTTHHYGDVSVRLDWHVALIQIHRPPHNYFDPQLIQDLADAFEAMDQNHDCRFNAYAAAGDRRSEGKRDVLHRTAHLRGRSTRVGARRCTGGAW
jgi:hypothetical protein